MFLVETVQVCGKYLKNSPMQLEFVPQGVRSEIQACIDQAREDKSLLGPELFLEVQKALFRKIFDLTFCVLKSEYPER